MVPPCLCNEQGTSPVHWELSGLLQLYFSPNDPRETLQSGAATLWSRHAFCGGEGENCEATAVLYWTLL